MDGEYVRNLKRVCVNSCSQKLEIIRLRDGTSRQRQEEEEEDDNICRA